MPNESAATENKSITTSLSVGKIEKPHWLWSGLEAIASSSNARNGVLIIFSQKTRGRIGIFCNRYISGAVIDGTEIVGLKALQKLLRVESGMFGFRLCAPSEGLELKQDLAIDLQDILAMRSELVGKTPADALAAADVGEVESGSSVHTAIHFAEEGSALEFGEMLGATGSYYSDGAEMPGESLFVTTTSTDSAKMVEPEKPKPSAAETPAQAKPAAESSEKTSGQQVAHYLDWLSAGPAESKVDVPSLNKVLKPIMSSGVSRAVQASGGGADEDFKLYSRLVEEESAKISALLEQSNSSADAQTKPDQRMMDDLRLLNDFLKSEQSRAQRWSSNDLDAIPTPGKGTAGTPPPSPPQPSGSGSYAVRKALKPGQFAGECDDLVSSVVLKSADRQKFVKLQAIEEPPRETIFDKIRQNRRALITIYALVVGAVVALFWFVNSMSQTDTLMDQGLKALRANKPDDALLCFGAAVKNNPKSGKAYFCRGLAYSAIGQPKLAIDDMNTALKLGQSSKLVLATRATLYLKIREYDKAVADCTSLLFDDPQNVEGYKIRAIAQSHLDQYDAAITDCNKALAMTKDPKTMAQLYRERGVAHLRLNAYKEAVEDLTKAIAANPTQWTYLNRAEAYRASKKYADAVADYTKVLKLDPSSYSAYVARGICAVKLKRYDAALADLDEALKIQPRSVEALIQRGSVYLGQEQWQKAADDFQVASSLNPFVAEATEKLSTAVRHLKKQAVPRTIAQIESELPVSNVKLPEDPRQLMALGYNYMNSDSFDQAVLCFSEAVRRDPNNPTPRKYLAYSFAERGDSVDALVQLDHLNKMGLLDDRDKLLFAKCLTTSGRPVQAVPLLIELVRANPAALEVKEQLAKAYYAAGDKDKAKALATEGRSQSRTAQDQKRFDDILQKEKDANLPPAQ